MNPLWLPVTGSILKNTYRGLDFTDLASIGHVYYAQLHELKRIRSNLFVTTFKGEKVGLDEYLMLCSEYAFTSSELKDMGDPITAAGLLLAQQKATEVRVTYKERLDLLQREKEDATSILNDTVFKLNTQRKRVGDLEAVISLRDAYSDTLFESNKILNEEITSLKTSEHEQKVRADTLNKDNNRLRRCLGDMGSKLEAAEIDKQRLNQSISSIEESMSKNTCGGYDNGSFIAVHLNGDVPVYQSFNEAAVAVANMSSEYSSSDVRVLKIVGEAKRTVQVIKV